MKDKVLVFYANMFYREYRHYRLAPFRELTDLPDGSYIRLPPLWDGGKVTWFRSDFTPALDSDVPKELLVLCLLLT